jgi:predicted ArsR family transcriptional regulator
VVGWFKEDWLYIAISKYFIVLFVQMLALAIIWAPLTNGQMPTADLGKRFLGTTRGQIVSLLRRGTRTVEQLARSLGLTDNAVRNHLGTLERDRIVRAEGVRRSPGAGKPAVLYEVRPDAEPLLSRAYAPVLSTMMDVLADTLPPDQVDELLREVGRRLAPELGGRASGSLDERAAAAAALLQALGGEVDVVKEDGALRLRVRGGSGSFGAIGGCGGRRFSPPP